jgi:hypothetical protein
MFTFLNSIILTALVAGLIPVLIHLFNKQKAKKIKFSSLRFLKKLEKRRLKKVKIYQIILIIIRTLLIVLLVFAFARPTFSGSWSILQEPSANTTATVIVDDGLNMRQYDASGNRFNRALIRLNQVLKSFETGDRIQILKTSNTEIDLSDSTNIVLQECSFVIGDLNSALLKAGKYFEENPNINKELHIISDMQILTDQFEKFAQKFEEVKIYLENINQKIIGNISIDNIEFVNAIFEINKSVSMKVTLRNQFSDAPMNVNMHIFINDKRMAQKSVVLQSGEQKTISSMFIPKMYGWNVGYVEIDDDDLLADNRFYFSIYIPEKIQVLWLDDSASPYLLSAIEAIQKTTNIDIVRENYNSAARQNFADYDVLFLSNLPDLSDILLTRLQTFSNNGGGIILVPGDKTVPASFNASLNSLLNGLKILNLKNAENSGSYFSLKEIKTNNPVLSNLFQKETPELTMPKFKKYFVLENSLKYQTLIQFIDGNPFLLYSDREGLKTFILSSYFDDSWSDIQYKGIFIPLLIKMFKISAFKLDLNKNQVIVGKDFIYTTERNTGINEYHLISPNGDKIRISPIFSGTQLTFDLQSLNIPGIYKIQQGPKILTAISANVDAKKLGNFSINSDELDSRYKNIQLIGEDADVNEKVKEARFGEEIWKYVVALALLFLFLEGFVVKKIEGKF